MSVVMIGGEAYVAGMLWLPALEKSEIAKAGKSGRRNYNVRYGELVGLVDGEGNPAGIAPLAPVVERVIGPDQGSWVAALATEEGEVCLVQQQAGALTRDGDVIFDREEDAWERFELVRESGGRAFVGPGLFEEHASRFAQLDLDLLSGQRASMAAVERDRGGRKNLVLTLLALIVLPVGGYLIWDNFIKEPPPRRPPPIPTVDAVIDRMTFVAGCENARRRTLLHVAGWDLKRVTCVFELGYALGISEEADVKNEERIAIGHGRFSKVPVMFAEWKLIEGFEPSVWRRIAEQQLGAGGGWEVVQVAESTAWAAVRLPNVLAKAGTAPNYVDYRNMVERAFGLQTVDVLHGPQPLTPHGKAETRLTMTFGLAEFYDRIRPLEGMEVVRVMTRPRERWGWIAEIRKQQAQTIQEPFFLERQARTPAAANRSN